MTVKKRTFADEDRLDYNPRSIPADVITGTIDLTLQYRLAHTMSFATGTSGKVTYFAGDIISDPALIATLYARGAVLQQAV